MARIKSKSKAKKCRTCGKKSRMCKKTCSKRRGCCIGGGKRKTTRKYKGGRKKKYKRRTKNHIKKGGNPYRVAEQSYHSTHDGIGSLYNTAMGHVTTRASASPIDRLL